MISAMVAFFTDQFPARVRGVVPGATLATMPGLGHLAHEERPEDAAALILEFARQVEGVPA